MCSYGNLLRSSALAFNENRLQEELNRERTEKDNIHIQNSTLTNKSTDADEKKDSVYIYSLENMISTSEMSIATIKKKS